MTIRLLTLAGISLFTSPLAQADDDAFSGYHFEYTASLTDASATSPSREPAPSFGDPNSGWWLTLGGGVASTFGSDTDSLARASFTTFVAQDVQLGVEVGAWYFNMPGDNAYALNPALTLRWHFYNDNDWTLFLDSGIGVLVASADVPQGGTSVNFTPRFGAGFTRLLSDDGTRFEIGVRWHHVSNARIFGDGDNPSRDLPLFFFGIVIPL